MSLSAGSIAFVGFNADGTDDLAFVALETIAAGTKIHFSDRTWNGTSFSGGESAWTWTATTEVAAGTVVTFSNLASGTLSTTVGSVAYAVAGVRGLSASSETVYAYQGTDHNTPSTFLAAIASKNFTDAGVLTGTGLTAGTNAVNLNDTGGVDIGAYTGARGDQTSYAAYLAQLNNAANWTTQDATGDQSIDAITPDTPFDTTAFTVCYAAGTRIATPTGDTAIEALVPGDLVLTLRDGQAEAMPVRWVGWRRIDLRRHPAPHFVAPVVIAPAALGDGLPRRPLILSPDHGVMIEGALVPAHRLVNHMTIRQDQGCPSVDYLHVELDRHAILLAEGVAAESYLDTGNRGFFANGGGPVTLHPTLTPARGAGSCIPFLEADAAIEPIWRRLADRARALGFIARDVETTEDPALMLDLGEHAVAPLHNDGTRVTFLIPAGIRRVWLRSRADRPTRIRPWSEDRRLLGVRLSRLALEMDGNLTDIPLDHPQLSVGWWPVEREIRRLRRWTDGCAQLDLPDRAGPIRLRLWLSDQMRYPVGSAQRDRRAA